MRGEMFLWIGSVAARRPEPGNRDRVAHYATCCVRLTEAEARAYFTDRAQEMYPAADGWVLSVKTGFVPQLMRAIKE